MGESSPPLFDEQRLRRRFVALLALGSIAWAAFAWLVAPRLIGAAYEGRGLSFLVSALEHRASYPLEHYLAKWNGVASLVLGGWLAAGGLLLITTGRSFARRFVGTAPPSTLGAIRIVVCAALAISISQLTLIEMAGLPDSQRVSMGVMDLLYAAGWQHVVHGVPLLRSLHWLCLGLSLAGMVGYQTRRVLPLLAILYLALAGIPRSYFWFHHSGLIPWYSLVVLCFAGSGDAWSMDRFLAERRGEPAPRASPSYAWARLAVWLSICIPYALAGASKLRFGGWSWWSATNMQQIFFARALGDGDDRVVTALLSLPEWCFAAVGLLTVATELGMLVVPFWARARLLLPPLMIGMHLAASSVMDIDFYDLIVLQAAFYDWTPLWNRLARRSPAVAAGERAAPRRTAARSGAKSLGAGHPVEGDAPHRRAPRRGALPRGGDAFSDPTEARFGDALRALAAPCGIALLVWILAGVWVLRLEAYPLTSMQMFSNEIDARNVDYYRAYVTYADGTTEPARFAEMGGGVERYTPALEWAFRSEKSRLACIELMQRSASWWNRHHPDRPVVHFEARHSQWSIDRARADPSASGIVVATEAIDVAPEADE